MDAFAGRVLDLNDRRAEVGERHGREGAGQDAAEAGYDGAVEGTE